MEAIYKGYTLHVDYTKKCETTIKELDIKFPSIKDAKDYIDKKMEASEWKAKKDLN